ncbi:YezD family protein [Cognatilysobacter tabacisoli]|uniref:YezD family protein n=1 Tax=Cognatilysobacter tabacisoli TaxID=2315424 RepID=UPI000E6B2236|nr:YezD family protein [Lysobacter tabacisoli]
MNGPHPLPRRADPQRDPLALTEAERAVLQALRELRYGQVDVIVHSGRIVQITRSQKLRVDER